MSMEAVLDSVRKIVHKWVNTFSPISENVSRGDFFIPVVSIIRFKIGDQLMLKNDSVYETGLIIKSIDIDNKRIELISAILNDWTVSENTVLIKTIHEQFIQGIYIGDPDVIPRYPAITVNGTTRTSEWLTLKSTKERYELEISVFVKASTHESGYRFLMNLADTIQLGLKRNIMPLLDDYDVISLKEDAEAGDVNLKVNEIEKLDKYKRIILEDNFSFQEAWVTNIYDDNESIKIDHQLISDFDKSDTTVIVPHRFIFNSWPATIEYGKVHKGELLKAAVIRWFAEEEEVQFLQKGEMNLR